MQKTAADRPVSPWRCLLAALRWTHSSHFLMSAFAATLFVIVVVWWPLVVENLGYIDPARPLWAQMDWLLLGIFAVMSLLIMAGADLKADALIISSALPAGWWSKVWGTQTGFGRTLRRAPAVVDHPGLADRQPVHWSPDVTPKVRSSDFSRPLSKTTQIVTTRLYEFVLADFCGVLCVDGRLCLAHAVKTTHADGISPRALLILTPTDHRLAVLTFLAGSGLR